MDGEHSNENSTLRRQLEVSRALIEADLELFSCRGRHEVIEKVAEIVTRRLGWADFAFLMRAIEQGRPKSDLRAEKATGVCQQDRVLSACCHVIPAREPIRMKLFGGDLLAIPVFVRGVLSGVLDFFSPKEGALDEILLDAFTRLSTHTGTALSNAALVARTDALLAIDPLTLLCNRQAMDKRIEVELARAQRQAQPLTILMADLDHFQHYTAVMGASWGEETLRSVASIIRNALRQVDEVGRLVGEEFCILLPGTAESAGLVVARKLCAAVQGLRIPGAGSQPLGWLSLSVGLATVADHVDAFTPYAKQQLCRMAGLAAAEAKRRGRNRVVSAAEMLATAHPVERLHAKAEKSQHRASAPKLIPVLELGRPLPRPHLSP